MIVKGYACHFNQRNANGEIVTAQSFTDTLKYHSENKIAIPINYNHNADMILGHVTDYQLLPDGLFIVAELNDDVDTVKNFVAPLVKDGTLNRFSTEGLIKYADLERLSDDTYIAKVFELQAIAIVNNPADVGAVISYNGRRTEQTHFFDGFNAKKNNKMLYII